MSKYFFHFCLLFLIITNVTAQSPVISVNQLGYLKHKTKYAWVSNLIKSGEKWYVKKCSDNSIAYTSEIKSIGDFDESCGEKVLRLDFSSLNADGKYFIEIEGVGKSFEFEISDHCYNKAFKAAVKSYYFQRSGFELTPEFAGVWAKPASHTNDGFYYKGFEGNLIIKGNYRNCNGGWYDAGDFGKKIVPASVALYPFLKLAEFYPEVVASAEIDIPNPYKDLPDLLSEAKWELDWFFSMQEDNGGVHHLIVTPEFFMGPAQNDPQVRYILTISTAATADFAAIMALASMVYKSYLPSFADSCLVAAEKAWEYLKSVPAIFPEGGYIDPPGINGTGAYGDANDKDERLWASAELFSATKKEEYRQYFESNYASFYVYGAGGWMSTSNYAFYTWIQTMEYNYEDRTSKIIKDRLLNWANSIEASSKNRGYGVALNKNSYSWGSNSNVLNIGMEMLIINKLFRTDKYTDAALEQLNYILGCNSLNLCFLSGFGTNAVKDPHQCINTYDNKDIVPEGFVPGGPNSYIDKWDIVLYNHVKKNNLPPAKCYIDKHESFASNEVCVVYNSGLVFLSGAFFQGDPNLKSPRK